ncbi:hypothetical protein [Leuconostoc citreum]|uniref:hypothetical protein n=1 Tax=Leuconostoc citreum TaxID=33964 RepID=UPI0032DF9A9B
MKNLRQFLKFDADNFFKDKVLVAIDVLPSYLYVDGERSEKIIGCKIESVIAQDNTNYLNESTNIFEKLNIKIIDNVDFQIDQMAKFKILKFEKATVFGQYQNLLSIEVLAQNIKVIVSD